MNAIFFMITGLFFALLIIKELTKKKFCVICVSVSLTWIILLSLWIKGEYSHPLFLGVLMGESAVGMYYLLEKKTSERFHIFRLPTLLTFTFGVFSVVERGIVEWQSGVLIGVLWIVFTALFFYRENPRFRGVVGRIIACCRDW